MSSRPENPGVKSTVDARLRQSGFVLLAIALGLSLWAMTRAGDKPLLDLHSFRQTQTAMSAYYMAQDAGMFFDYITPVLGKPWQIPMEVPIYQWIVARLHNVTGIGLDESGKLISIVFWLACLWPVWRLLACLGFSHPQRCLAGAVVYSSPLYLYWGRSFMIETTGLFLSLAMVLGLFAGYKKHDWRWLLAGLVFGLGAALCKVTTWAPAVGVTILLILFSAGRPKFRDWKWIIASCAILVSPLFAVKLWFAYGDSVKSTNPFVHELSISSSTTQRDWTFGTLHQKFAPETWEHIWRHITDQLLAPLPALGPFLMVLVLAVGAIASPKRIPLIMIFLAGFASAPAIFTNLYFEHSYYWCANGIWLLLAVGTALAGICEYRPERIWPQAIATTLALVIALSGFVAWSQRSLPILQSLPTREQFDAAWRNPVQKIVPPERTILIVSNDWNPTSLYYAERKGIALANVHFSIPGPQLEESLAKLDAAEALGAVVINEQLISAGNKAGIAAILEQLDMSLEGTRTPFGILFPALDLKFGEMPTNE